MTISKQNSGDLKTRVNSCLNKLSDRDTLSMAANELESIAKSLPNDSFAPFINCLSATDSSEKSPVRRHSVRLLGVLSAAHGDALSPHLSRMISAVLRRLRDSDSAVRSACVDAVSSITTHVNSPPFSVILKPLVDALFHEQDLHAQIGAALCLSAAVDASTDIDVTEVRKLVPKALKLVRSDCFKAKPSLLSFIGSIIAAGCAKGKGLLNSVVSTAVEFLSSEDWAARKAAAEVLEKIVSADTKLAAEFKDSCVSALESRRFDKVKIVRETMNRALEMWKNLPAISEDSSSPKDSDSSSKSKSKCNVDSPIPHFWGRRNTICLHTPEAKKIGSIRSPSSTTTSSSSTPKPNFENHKESENLSSIREQLLQIENQQSNLLELLQRFMGSSQKGMSSLEKRVEGLEKVVDEMSQDFAISTRGMSATDSCCIIPGAEFLSPKFWRKTDHFYSHANANAKLPKFATPTN